MGLDTSHKLTHIFEEFLPSLWRDLRYYTGLNLDYTHSGQYGYQLVLTRDNKNGIERTLVVQYLALATFMIAPKQPEISLVLFMRIL